MTNELLKDLAKAKVAFQQRSILTVMGVSPANNRRMEDGEICAICQQDFMEDYGHALACESCGGDGVLATYENQHQGY